MAHKKLIRFEAIKSFPNVFELPQNMEEQWTVFFKNQHPLVLELACGKGEYTIGLARLYPQKNYIGVDIKGNRIWRGALTAIEENLPNVAFLRTPIEGIHQYFTPHTVEAIWITFPDPQLRLSKAKKKINPSTIFTVIPTSITTQWHCTFKNRQSGSVLFHQSCYQLI